MDCIPAGMEAFCAEDEEQFEVIKKVIDLCDYYILIIGKRYGSINESKGISYTEMEYDYAVEKGIPVLVFPVNDSVDLPTDNNQELLNKFKAKAFGKRMGAVWKNADDLSKHVAISLRKTIDILKRPGWTRDNVYDQSELLSQINTLRISNDKLSQDKENLKKTNSKLQDENEQLKNELDDMQSGNKELIPLEELVLDIDYYGVSGLSSKQIKAEEIFGKVSIKMIGVSFKSDYFKEQIYDAIGLSKYSVKDDALVDKICNYFVALKLISSSWNDKRKANFFGLTKKGIKERDRLNGFWRDKQ